MTKIELNPHFWEFCAAGAFLQWGVKRESGKSPGTKITCTTPSGYALCGFNPDPDVWNGETVVLVADPETCGLPKE